MSYKSKWIKKQELHNKKIPIIETNIPSRLKTGIERLA
jgi:hypothetical protein